MTIIEIPRPTTPTHWPIPWVKRRAARLGKGLGAAIKRAQVARMQSVLSELTDEQLAGIGVRRRDIPDYAASLIHGPGAWKAR